MTKSGLKEMVSKLMEQVEKVKGLRVEIYDSIIEADHTVDNDILEIGDNIFDILDQIEDMEYDSPEDVMDELEEIGATNGMEEGEEEQTDRYDVVLIQKPHSDGVSCQEMEEMYGLLSSDCAIPIEIQGESAVAMGLINLEKAEAMDYDLSMLERSIKGVLDDMDLESKDGIYTIPGIGVSILMRYGS